MAAAGDAFAARDGDYNIVTMGVTVLSNDLLDSLMRQAEKYDRDAASKRRVVYDVHRQNEALPPEQLGDNIVIQHRKSTSPAGTAENIGNLAKFLGISGKIDVAYVYSPEFYTCATSDDPPLGFLREGGMLMLSQNDATPNETWGNWETEAGKLPGVIKLKQGVWKKDSAKKQGPGAAFEVISPGLGAPPGAKPAGYVVKTPQDTWELYDTEWTTTEFQEKSKDYTIYGPVHSFGSAVGAPAEPDRYKPCLLFGGGGGNGVVAKKAFLQNETVMEWPRENNRGYPIRGPDKVFSLRTFLGSDEVLLPWPICNDPGRDGQKFLPHEIKDSGGKGKAANVEFVAEDGDSDSPYHVVRALRAINEGEELLADHGASYFRGWGKEVKMLSFLCPVPGRDKLLRAIKQTPLSPHELPYVWTLVTWITTTYPGHFLRSDVMGIDDARRCVSSHGARPIAAAGDLWADVVGRELRGVLCFSPDRDLDGTLCFAPTRQECDNVWGSLKDAAGGDEARVFVVRLEVATPLTFPRYAFTDGRWKRHLALCGYVAVHGLEFTKRGWQQRVADGLPPKYSGVDIGTGPGTVEGVLPNTPYTHGTKGRVRATVVGCDTSYLTGGLAVVHGSHMVEHGATIPAGGEKSVITFPVDSPMRGMWSVVEAEFDDLVLWDANAVVANAAPVAKDVVAATISGAAYENVDRAGPAAPPSAAGAHKKPDRPGPAESAPGSSSGGKKKPGAKHVFKMRRPRPAPPAAHRAAKRTNPRSK